MYKMRLIKDFLKEKIKKEAAKRQTKGIGILDLCTIF